ncbi:MAG: ABC transporter substrate-binding protein [Thermomicrobiales bacterium]
MHLLERSQEIVPEIGSRTINRRSLLGMVGAAGFTIATRGLTKSALAQADAGQIDELVIDLPSELPSLDPALVYDIDGWSIIHSIYDSVLQYQPNGEIELLLAKSLTQSDPLTWEIELVPDVKFHNGEPLTSQAVTFAIAHLVDDKTASQVGGNFKIIERVEEIDELKARLHLSAPAPWLPSMMAAWLTLLPPDYAAANDFAATPVGTGPYKFVEYAQGDHLALEANPDYFQSSPKGQPIAKKVTFRFVPEAITRVADLLSGSAGIIRTDPGNGELLEQQGLASVVAEPVSGSSFIRIATDAEPFRDARVRQALNFAVDVDTIIHALFYGHGSHLASLFVEGGLGFDPNLTPFPHDPEKAKSLLAEAGFPTGFSTQIEHTVDEGIDVIEAIVGQLGAVGIKAERQPRDKAAFNQSWKDPKAAPLRFVTWRPLFDPYTLLSLVISNQGFLSRYSSDTAQPLIDAGAVEPDPAKRAQTYQQLAKVLQDDPAAIYLYNLTALYGTAKGVPEWTQRPDDYIIPAKRP